VQQKERSIYFAALLNGDAENWFGQVISADPIDVNVNAFHVDRAPGTSPAELEITVEGITVDPTLSLNHEIGVIVNDVEVGEIVFSGQISATQKFSIPAAQLIDGANTIRLIARAGDADYSLVDVVHLSYWHTYQADADMLAASADGPGVVRFGGFAAGNIRLMDITDPTAVEELQGVIDAEATGTSAISARVTSAGARMLFGFTGATVNKPEFLRTNQPSSWHSAGLAYDYVAITHANFASAAEELAVQRRRDGLTAAVVDVDDLYDEFNFGEKTPQAIKDFVHRARTSWKRAPKYLVLVGDATLDPRDYMGFGGADFVPSKQLPMAQVSLETASDDWYADDDADGVPDAAVGRLSVRTSDQAFEMVDKILAYANGDAGAWTKNVLLVADENDDVTNFERLTAGLQALVPAGYTVHPILRGQLGLDAARAELTAAVNEGQLIVNYVGHGSVHVWGHDASLLTSDDIHTAWHTGTRLPLVVAMSCLNGFFHDIYDEESMAETLLRAPQGGAVAAWASSALTLPAAQAAVNQELFRLIFTQPGLTIGEAVAAAKRSIPDRDVRRSWIFFGDPAMRLIGAQTAAKSTTSTTTRSGGSVAAASTSSAETPTATPGGAPFDAMPATRLADWDRDRRADVFLSRAKDWRALLMAPNGRVQADAWDIAWDAHPADLNGDGATDLVLYDRHTGVWAQAMNDGATHFIYTYGTWGHDWDVHVGDLNGDGREEVLLTNPTTGDWSTALSDGKGHFTQRFGNWPTGLSTVVLGDFNGDGRADAFLYNRDSGAWRLAYSDRNGDFTVVTNQSAPGWSVRSANLNGDNRADLLFYNASTGQWSACVSGDGGQFNCRNGVWRAGLQVILLDAKGADDVLLYNPVTGAWTLLTSSDNGATLIVNGAWAPHLTIATGDVNADGRTDLLLYDAATGAWTLGLARGAGRFEYSAGEWNADWSLALRP
jgi:hypothetical protein